MDMILKLINSLDKISILQTATWSYTLETVRYPYGDSPWCKCTDNYKWQFCSICISQLPKCC